MGYVLVLLGASLAVGSPPAQAPRPPAAATVARAHRPRFWRRLAGAEPALALRLSSWGIGKDRSTP